jgi:hypothetical protein
VLIKNRKIWKQADSPGEHRAINRFFKKPSGCKFEDHPFMGK